MTRPSNRKGNLLVVGPGARGRGGIAAVIRLHSMTAAWQRRQAEHLETFDDRTGLSKVWSAVRAYLLAPAKIIRADIVHIHLAAQTSLLRKLPIVWMTRLLRRPLIVHIHAPSEEVLFARTPQWAVRSIFRATRVVALSEGWATIMRRHMPNANIVVLPNPVLSHPFATPTIPPIVLFVGKLDARKGYADLLAAAAIVLKQVPTAEFLLCGHGETAQARALSQQLGIAGSIHLPGWVDAEGLALLYAHATAVALPSYAEGVPMSVIEAMSHGVPVVCTPVGGLPEWIDDGRNGLFVQPGDVPALAAQLLRLLQQPELAASMGRAGQATVQQRCSLDSVSEPLDELYTSVLRSAQAPKQAGSLASTQ